MIPKFEYEYVSYEELYRAYLDCRKRKRTTYNALEFEINDTERLYRLWHELNTFDYEVGKSIVFCVEKPVKREVFAADFRDRIIHHLIINRLNDYFEKEFIDDSYSCRKGKGTDFGIRRCYAYIREATSNYTEEKIIVKCDLKSFFMTIDKTALYNKLEAFVRNNHIAKNEKDYNFILYILKKIVFNEPQHNCIRKQSIKSWDTLPKDKSLFYCDANKGLPIGNLTSQIFANFYLSEFDHYVKEELRVRWYGRYVDDFYMIVDTREEASRLIKLCRSKLGSMGVMLHPKKLYQQSTHKGVKFIGAVIKHGRIYISNRTKGNLYEALRDYSKALDDRLRQGTEPTLNEIEHFVGSVNSYIGFMVHYKTFNIRRKLLFSAFMKQWREYCYFDDNLKKITSFREYTRLKGKKKRECGSMYYFYMKDVYQMMKLGILR